MHRLASRIILFGITVLVLSLSANANTYFIANLNSAQEVPPNASTASGVGRVTLNAAETQIIATFYWTGLSANASAGHIHGPAGPGSNAGVLFDMMPSAATAGSAVARTFSVTPTQVSQLKAGLWYFNIHTSTNPGGEIRGQILVDSPFVAYMDNNQENPPSVSSARGSGAISFNPATNQALVTMTWNGLTVNATGGHVHNARSRVNGPVICDLMPGAATNGMVVDRLCTFTPAQATLLRQAQLYLNIHTSTFPGGEIRGQIQRRRSTVVDFDGDSKTDYAIARPNTSSGVTEWWINNSSGGISAFPHGTSTEFSTGRILAADYDNDGKDDPIVWRSATSPNAGFIILQSSNNTAVFEQFGTTGDDPRVTYDYDGDGRADPAVFRSSDDTWYYLGTSNNPARNITFIRWGTTFANPGDFDGDGRGDFVDQQGGNWWLLRSSDFGVRVITIGTGSSFGVPGDYDGDGKVDVGVTNTEGSSLAWYYASSLNPSQSAYVTRREWGPGAGTRVRSQGDYDGDGRSDYGVWIEGATSAETGFWVLPSNGSPHIFAQWGQSTTGTNDFPITGYNNR